MGHRIDGRVCWDVVVKVNTPGRCSLWCETRFQTPIVGWTVSGPLKTLLSLVEPSECRKGHQSDQETRRTEFEVDSGTSGRYGSTPGQKRTPLDGTLCVRGLKLRPRNVGWDQSGLPKTLPSQEEPCEGRKGHLSDEKRRRTELQCLRDAGLVRCDDGTKTNTSKRHSLCPCPWDDVSDPRRP